MKAVVTRAPFCALLSNASRTTASPQTQSPADLPSGVERFSRVSLADLQIEAPRFLGDLVAAPAGWEESVDFFLEPLRDAIVVPADLDAL